MTIFQQLEAAAKAKNIRYSIIGDQIGLALKDCVFYWFMDLGAGGVIFTHKYSQNTGKSSRAGRYKAYEFLKRRTGVDA